MDVGASRAVGSGERTEGGSGTPRIGKRAQRTV